MSSRYAVSVALSRDGVWLYVYDFDDVPSRNDIAKIIDQADNVFKVPYHVDLWKVLHPDQSLYLEEIDGEYFEHVREYK